MGDDHRRTVAAAGLIIGALLGMAGSFAPSAELRGLAWGVDGVALIVASALLVVHHVRQGDDQLAAGFLVFLAGETLIVSGSAMELDASAPLFAAGAGLWAAALALISASRVLPAFVRVTGAIAAALFAVTAARMFGGAALTPLSKPLPFYAYPFLAVTLFGWAWAHVRPKSMRGAAAPSSAAVLVVLMTLAAPTFSVPVHGALVLGAQRAPAPPSRQIGRPAGSVRVSTLPWTDAERLLDTATVVMIPLGAEAKEHGPHLPLNNDWLLAEYFTKRVMAATRVVVYPTINYNFYPAFAEYPGSTGLRLETARDVVVDIVRSIARHGPRRFYILNTGVSTLRALAPARDSLAASGIVMVYTDILNAGRDAAERVIRQDGGTHADELETSVMLYMHPEVVRMSKAPNDYHPGAGPLTRDSAIAVRDGKTWSRTGTFGNATLATREKGRAVVEAQVRDMVQEVERLRRTPIP